MIIAADDMCHTHTGVVDRDSKIVGRHTRRAHQDEIAEDGVLKLDVALNKVIYNGCATLWNPKSDDSGTTLRFVSPATRTCRIASPGSSTPTTTRSAKGNAT